MGFPLCIGIRRVVCHFETTLQWFVCVQGISFYESENDRLTTHLNRYNRQYKNDNDLTRKSNNVVTSKMH